MARPKKWRRVCEIPSPDTFGPIGQDGTDEQKRPSETVFMSIEGYEVIRWMDHEGLNQEETAARMDVARSTVQRIYDEARKIIADGLVNGKILKIQGGDYKLCSEYLEKCGPEVCVRKECCKKAPHEKRCCEKR